MADVMLHVWQRGTRNSGQLFKEAHLQGIHDGLARLQDLMHADEELILRVEQAQLLLLRVCDSILLTARAMSNSTHTEDCDSLVIV